MSTQNFNMETFTNSFENVDTRTTLREKLTILDISSDWELKEAWMDGDEYLVISGPTTPDVAHELDESPTSPLSLELTVLDGDTGETLTYMEVQ